MTTLSKIDPLARRIRSAFASCIVAGALAAFSASPALADENEEFEEIQSFLGLMDSYFGVIESVYRISSSAEKSAIHQMSELQEVYEERGEQAKLVGALRDVLKRTQNPAIRNAAYMMLGDVLKETGRADEAIVAITQGLNENLARVK